MAVQGRQKLGATLSGNSVTFCVWAPFATAVSVLINDSFTFTETPMANKDGYWSVTVDDVEIGRSYKYRITDAAGNTTDRNDPYARQLTDSDLGASVIVDPHIDWDDTAQPVIPKEEHIIYELHVGTFHRPDASTSGTLDSAIEKLDYLASLGITTIELMPITSMATSTGWGYNPTHLFAIENAYGGRRGLLNFVTACHKRGLAVIVDVVYNHFYEKSDLWQFDGWNEHNQGGIYFYNDERGTTPWGVRPDYGRPEVRQYILDNVTMWLADYKLDGLRLDSTTYMRNTRGPEGGPDTAIEDAWTLLQDITTLAHKINPQALVIAEDSSGDASVTQSVKEGGAGFDAQWGISFPQGIRAGLGLENANYYDGSLRRELESTYNDEAFQKVVFGDSHDTAANGAERLNEAATPGNAGSIFARQYGLIANAITLTAPGIPMILQGEEFMQGGHFNDWQQLDWDRTTQFAGIVLAHQHLINLRLNHYQNTAGLTGKSINVFHQDEDNQVLAYHRWHKGGVCDDTLVIINFSDKRFKEYQLTVPIAGSWRVRFNSSWKGYSSDFNETKPSLVPTDENQTITLPLADYNVLILSQD